MGDAMAADPVIANVALDHWYPRAQDRLSAALDAQGFRGTKLFWKQEYPPDSPTQHVVPYAFKLYAIAEALRRGHRMVLWTDAASYPIGPVEPVFEHIARQGYLLMALGHNIGEWCSDEALPRLGLTREEAFAAPSAMGGFIGLDFRHPIAVTFFQRWLKLAVDGTAFRAPWVNVPTAPRPLWIFSHDREGFVSADPRVKGHRHDQTAASAIAHHLKMRLTPPPRYFDYYTPIPAPETVFVLDRRPLPE